MCVDAGAVGRQGEGRAYIGGDSLRICVCASMYVCEYVYVCMCVCVYVGTCMYFITAVA